MQTKSRLEGIDRVTVITDSKEIQFLRCGEAQLWLNHVKAPYEILFDHEFEMLLDGYRAAGCVVIPEADEENTYRNVVDGIRDVMNRKFETCDDKAEDFAPILGWKTLKSLDEWGLKYTGCGLTCDVRIPGITDKIHVIRPGGKPVTIKRVGDVWQDIDEGPIKFTKWFIEEHKLPIYLNSSKCVVKFIDKHGDVFLRLYSGGNF